MLTHALPLLLCHVCCGFPSPADDFRETVLDLNDRVMTHPAATFYVRVSGDSMRQAAIGDGDILVVDRAQEAHHQDIVLVRLNGAFTVKRLYQQDGKRALLSENPRYSPMLITEEMDFQVWGVVTYCIHRVS